MRALVVSPRMPPARKGADFGGDKRLRLFVDGLAEVFDEIDFVYLAPEHVIRDADLGACAAEAVWGVRGSTSFAPLARRQETFFNHYVAGIVSASGMQDFFPFTGPACVAGVTAALDRRPALIFIHQLDAMLPALAAQPRAPMLFDMADLMSRTHWRTVMSEKLRPGSLAYALQAPAIFAAERRGVRAAACSAVAAEADRRILVRSGVRGRTATVPNAVDVPVEAPGVPEAPTLLFLGNYEYEPNKRAAERLVRRIWPMVSLARPDARLLFAGRALERVPSLSAPPSGVEALGFVEDLATLYSRTRVVCCPIDVGGGTRLKLIEAAAYARPMVSTRIGAENLGFVDDAEILLRDEDASFAKACVELFDDEAGCARIGAAARAKVQELYEAGAVRRQVAALAWSILERAASATPSRRGGPSGSRIL